MIKRAFDASGHGNDIAKFTVIGASPTRTNQSEPRVFDIVGTS